MTKKTYIGIDNGTTGALGIIAPDGAWIEAMPTKKELSYTKKKQYITRIDEPTLVEFLGEFRNLITFALVERPMVNPTRHKATLSAIRALEATLIALELSQIPYQYIDSKEWQSALLPAGLKGDELKTASNDIGKRLFPNLTTPKNLKDYDAILIAEYARRKNL